MSLKSLIVQKKRVSRHSTGWLRTMRDVQGDKEIASFKDVRRLAKVFGDLIDYDRGLHPWYKSHRNWKDHCKCRHQWEQHAFTVYSYDCYACSDGYKIAYDHNRKWILELLHKEKSCIIDTRHDDYILDVLCKLCNEGLCDIKENGGDLHLEKGLFEVTLLKQSAGIPRKKNSIGDKGCKGKYSRRKRQRERQKERNAAIVAVAERMRRARRHRADVQDVVPLANELFVPRNEVAS